MNNELSNSHQGAKTALLIGVAASIAVLFLPHPYYGWVAWPLMLLSTLFHEMGHGIAAVLTGNSFNSFQMWGDGSGLASISSSGGRIESAIISAGGLVGPAMVAMLLFWLGKREQGGKRGLLGLSIALALALLLVVRNPFGFVFIGVFAAVCLGIALFTSLSTARVALLFLGVQLSLSVFSRGDYLFVKEANTSAGVFPSDVANMATALFLPYWFWGAACGAFSLFVLFLGLRPFFSKNSAV
jgi:hypothetical protein